MRLLIELGQLQEKQLAEFIRDTTQRLIMLNEEILKGGRFPPLFSSAIRYVYNGGELADASVVYRRGHGDCGSIPAIRIAELHISGEDTKAYPQYRWKRVPDGRLLFHESVRRGDGRLEDPCLALGMSKPWDWS